MQESSGEPSVSGVSQVSEHHRVRSQQVADYSREKAFYYLQNGNPGRALAHFNVALSLMPDWRISLKDYFLQSLSGGCKKLQEEGKLPIAIELKEHALGIYPDDEAILCDIGTYYFQLGDIAQAEKFYKDSLEADIEFLPAIQGLQSVRSVQLERWHFRMLNDQGRNEGYRKAIVFKIQQGHQLVLDIGTGSGLLSLYAAREGASKIWACEVKSDIFGIANEVIGGNDCTNKIVVLNKMSTDLLIPKDIPEKVSLVVTEIFDAGLFGEGILQTLIHAWDNLLLPPCTSETKCFQPYQVAKTKINHGAVIPHSAILWVAAIQCVDIARRHRLLPSQCICRERQTSPDAVKDDCWINFGPMLLCKCCEGPLKDQGGATNYNILSDISVRTVSLEPYDAENLEVIPYGYRILSEPQQALTVNFNSVDDLKSLLHSATTEHILLANGHGSIDAIVSWFHLNLDNNSTIISSAPFFEKGTHRGWCWHQATFPVLHPIQVFPGKSIAVNLSTNHGKLNIIPNSDNYPTIYSNPVITVSQSVVIFLNNRTWESAFLETAKYLHEKFLSRTPSFLEVLDFYPFPVLGLALLRLCGSSGKLLAYSESPADECCIRYIAKQFGIETKQIEFFSDQSLCEAIQGRTFDVINLTLTESSGDLNEKLIDRIPDLRMKLSSHGVMVPHSVAIEGQIIESDWLLQNSSVASDANVGGFKVSEYVNKFMVDQHLHLNMFGIPFSSLSGYVEVIKLQTNDKDFGSLCSEFTKQISVTPSKSGKSACFLYWTKMYLQPEHTPVSTYCHDSHCNQAAFLYQVPVVEGSNVNFKLLYHYGIFKLKLESGV